MGFRQPTVRRRGSPGRNIGDFEFVDLGRTGCGGLLLVEFRCRDRLSVRGKRNGDVDIVTDAAAR